MKFVLFMMAWAMPGKMDFDAKQAWIHTEVFPSAKACQVRLDEIARMNVPEGWVAGCKAIDLEGTG